MKWLIIIIACFMIWNTVASSCIACVSTTQLRGGTSSKDTKTQSIHMGINHLNGDNHHHHVDVELPSTRGSSSSSSSSFNRRLLQQEAQGGGMRQTKSVGRTQRPTSKPTKKKNAFVPIGNTLTKTGVLQYGVQLALNYNGSVLVVADALAAVSSGNGFQALGDVDVYHLNNTSNRWNLTGSFTKVVKGEFSFGSVAAVSGDGTTLVIGSRAIPLGYVLVYRYKSNRWDPIGRRLTGGLKNSTIAPGGPSFPVSDGFGDAIAVSSNGTVIAVGSPNYNDGAGRVDVFRWNGTDWQSWGSKITGKGGGGFGSSISLSEDGATVGVSAAGAFRVFVHDRTVKGEWAQLGSDTNGTLGYDYFGHAAAMSANGRQMALSLTARDGSGLIRAFHYDSKSRKWLAIGKGISNLTEGLFQGNTVALSGDGTIVAVGEGIGAQFDVSRSRDRIYRVTDGTWTQIGSDLVGVATLAMSGDGKVIAASSGSIQAFQVLP